MRRAAATAAAVPSYYRPCHRRKREKRLARRKRPKRMTGCAGGVAMTDKLLGLMALAIGGALAWFLFEPVMSATAAHGVNTDTLLTVVVLLLGVLLGWTVVDRLRR
jgi:hypothetical protein